MSYEIIYGLEAVKFTAEEIPATMVRTSTSSSRQAGSSNFYRDQDRTALPDWSVAWLGRLPLGGHGCDGEPAEELRGRDAQAVRPRLPCRVVHPRLPQGVDRAVHGFDGAAERGLSFGLRLRFYEPDEYTSPSEKRPSDEWMIGELLKSRPMIQYQEYGSKFREFRFDRSEAGEWFKWANNRRGRHNAEVRGPGDPRPAQQELAFE